MEANPGAHVSVPHSPLTVGQSVYIEYYTDPGEDGTASVYVKRGGGGADIWDSGPQSITGGLFVRCYRAWLSPLRERTLQE